MLKMSYSGCQGTSPALSAQFTLKMCVAAGNRQKFTKIPIYGVQGHLRSSTLTPIKSLWLLPVMISSMSVSICNRFHSTRANSGIITTFTGWPSLMPASASLLAWTRGSKLGLLKSTFNGENFIRRLFWSISSHVVAIQCWNVRCIQKLQKKFTKTAFSGVQNRSGSLMLINLKSLSPVLVMISSMSVPICNRFHTERANNGKNNIFLGGTRLWRPRSKGTPAPGARNFVTKN